MQCSVPMAASGEGCAVRGLVPRIPSVGCHVATGLFKGTSVCPSLHRDHSASPVGKSKGSQVGTTIFITIPSLLVPCNQAVHKCLIMALITFLLLQLPTGRCVSTDLHSMKSTCMLQHHERVTSVWVCPLTAWLCAGTLHAMRRGHKTSTPFDFRSLLLPGTD